MRSTGWCEGGRDAAESLSQGMEFSYRSICVRCAAHDRAREGAALFAEVKDSFSERYAIGKLHADENMPGQRERGVRLNRPSVARDGEFKEALPESGRRVLQ